MEKIKIAYLLVVHNDPEQVNILVKQLLNYGDCDVYIHVDKKKDIIIDKIMHNQRISICSIYDVRWGSFEIVKAAYHLMQMAQESGKEYTHMYFGSGQDLLVKKGLYEYLSNHPQKTFIRINKEIKDNNLIASCYKINWPRKLMIRNDLHLFRFLRIGLQLLCRMGIIIYPNKIKLKNKIKFYEGRTWFIAPIEVMNYILTYINQNPDYVSFWENSLASDLMFFQTIIMNSEYNNKIEDELMFVNFGQSFRTKNHPLNITVKDNEKIENGAYFCARKFDIKQREDIEFYIQKVQK